MQSIELTVSWPSQRFQ